jgi:hypothetical protein
MKKRRLCNQMALLNGVRVEGKFALEVLLLHTLGMTLNTKPTLQPPLLIAALP